MCVKHACAFTFAAFSRTFCPKVYEKRKTRPRKQLAFSLALDSVALSFNAKQILPDLNNFQHRARTWTWNALLFFHQSRPWCAYSVLYCIENWCFSVKVFILVNSRMKEKNQNARKCVIKRVKKNPEITANAFTFAALSSRFSPDGFTAESEKRKTRPRPRTACGQSTSLIWLRNQCNFKPFEICRTV